MLSADRALVGRRAPAALTLLIHDTSAIMRPSVSQSIVGSGRHSNSFNDRQTMLGSTLDNPKLQKGAIHFHEDRPDGSPQHLVVFQRKKACCELTGSLPRLRLLSWFQQCEILGKGGGDFQASRAADQQPFIYTDLPGWLAG